MSKYKDGIIYGILWVFSLAMMFHSLLCAHNYAAYHHWAIAMAIFCGLFVGEIRHDDVLEKLYDQLASISFFLCVALLCDFSKWGLLIPFTVLFFVLFIGFGLCLLARMRRRAEQPE